MTDAWARDVAAGHDSALLAWRRADVHDLNRLARARYDQLGRLRRGRCPHVRHQIGQRRIDLVPDGADTRHPQ